jgi:hypothetical protein
LSKNTLNEHVALFNALSLPTHVTTVFPLHQENRVTMAVRKKGGRKRQTGEKHTGEGEHARDYMYRGRGRERERKKERGRS